MLEKNAKSIDLVDVEHDRPTESTIGLEVRNTNFYYTGEAIETQALMSIERSQCNIRAFVKYLVSKSGQNGVEYVDESDDMFHVVTASNQGNFLGTIVKIAKKM